MVNASPARQSAMPCAGFEIVQNRQSRYCCRRSSGSALWAQAHDFDAHPAHTKA